MTHTGSARPPIPWPARSLSVFVAAFNEAENLRPTVECLLGVLPVSVEEYEIIIVDDGSTDGTREVADGLAAQHPQIRVIHNPRNMGLGYAYQRAVEAAGKTFFVFIPGDNTWPAGSLLELIGIIGRSDVVTSYPTNPGVRPTGRRVVSAAYTRLLNLLFGYGLRYYNGLTIYPLEFLRSRPVATYGFGFAAEALLNALHRGLSLVEVGVPIDERTTGRSKAVTVRNIASVAAMVWRIYWALRAAPRLGMGRPAAPRLADPGGGTSGLHARGRAPLRVIITGASAGIAAGLVEALAADGHMLFVCARRAARLEEVTRRQTLARARPCDVTDEEQVRSFIAWVREHTPYIDAVLNCAGTIGAIGPADAADSAEWWNTVRVNLFGSYLMIKHALPLLTMSADPRILNFSGGGAFNTRVNYSAYACSKAGVVRLTECLAAELAPRGIAVNAVAPGFVGTEHHRPTLEVGPERAGELAYRRTKELLDRGAPQLTQVIDCVRALLSPAMRGLSGKTISANFDPWRTPQFEALIPDIVRSDLYAMRRINLVNLPEGVLRTALGGAPADRGARS